MAERHTPPPLLSAPLSVGAADHWAPSPDGASFLSAHPQPVSKLSLLPICWTECRCAYCMAVMSPNALLTKRSNPILALSLVKPLRILLPRTRFLRHRIETASSSRGDGSPVWRISSSHAQGQNLRFGFGPIIRLQLRLEPLFFAHLPGTSSSHLHANLHGSTSHCAFVPQAPISDIAFNGGIRGESASSKVSGPGQRPNGPAHPLGRGLLIFWRKERSVNPRAVTPA